MISISARIWPTPLHSFVKIMNPPHLSLSPFFSSINEKISFFRKGFSLLSQFVCKISFYIKIISPWKLG